MLCRPNSTTEGSRSDSAGRGERKNTIEREKSRFQESITFPIGKKPTRTLHTSCPNRANRESRRSVRYDDFHRTRSHLLRFRSMLRVCCGGWTSDSIPTHGVHAECGGQRAPQSPAVDAVAPMDRPRSPWRRSVFLKQEERGHFIADGLDICSPRQYDRHIKRIKGQSCGH
ncbi:uncharacterized protein TNCV_862691 [Trichonephila clavipes]|nr:uncharacterized protein TNCV_862691 [Trichonephila clavipes]